MSRAFSGHTPRKRFGQNFLSDDGVIQAIAHAIAPQSYDHIVEIGPGQGALTAALVASGCKLDAIELDRDLITLLLASFSIYNTFSLHSADALSFDYPSLMTSSDKLRVVGNLPYNISTPLLFYLLEHRHCFMDMHFMLQKEVVDRITATPGSKDWGRLGVMCQYLCEVECLFDVPPEAFYPAPKVQSAIVRLMPKHALSISSDDILRLRRVTQLAFAQRRKTLRNNFKGVLTDEALHNASVEPSARAESLSVEQFITLARAIPTS